MQVNRTVCWPCMRPGLRLVRWIADGSQGACSGIPSAHLATVGMLVWCACPEAGDQGVAGPEYLSAGTCRPDLRRERASQCQPPIQKPSTLEKAAPVAL